MYSGIWLIYVIPLVSERGISFLPSDELQSCRILGVRGVGQGNHRQGILKIRFYCFFRSTFNFHRRVTSKTNQSSFQSTLCREAKLFSFQKPCPHGLRTPNEGINQRYLKNWAEVADKICFGRT
jgi:hypothetical protein